MALINYSVIIPNKNNFTLLERCLASIPLRDDIQIIVVDDNSDSSKFDFSKYPGLERSGTEVVFTYEGGGAGFARNIGVSKAIGRWVVFADSDDFFLANAFSVLDNYVDSELDILYYNVTSVDSQNLHRSSRDKDYEAYIQLFLTGLDAKGQYIRFRKWEPWNKMINRRFIKRHKLRFDEIKRCNDMFFSLVAGYKAEKFDVIAERLYCVTTNPASITRTKINEEDFLECLKCAIKRRSLYRKIGRRTWYVNYILLFLYYVKNNGIFKSFSLAKKLFATRKELIAFSKLEFY